MPRMNFDVKDRKSVKVPSHIKPNRAWGPHFSEDYGFTLDLPHGNSVTVFVDKRLKSSAAPTILSLLKRGNGRARVITCEGNVWTVNTDLLGSDKFGISITTERGKVMMTGQGRIDPSGNLEFNVQTAYPRISNSPKKTTAGVSGTGHSDGSWEVTASVQVEF